MNSFLLCFLPKVFWTTPNLFSPYSLQTFIYQFPHALFLLFWLLWLYGMFCWLREQAPSYFFCKIFLSVRNVKVRNMILCALYKLSKAGWWYSTFVSYWPELYHMAFTAIAETGKHSVNGLFATSACLISVHKEEARNKYRIENNESMDMGTQLMIK